MINNQEKAKRGTVDFESLLFRWRYLSKISMPSSAEIEQYRSVINRASDTAYVSFTHQLKSCGVEREDLRSLAMVHVMSYIGLFSLQKNDDKRQRFIQFFEKKNGVAPSSADLDKKDKANAYSFVHQRLFENVMYFWRKQRSYSGITKQIRYFIGKPMEKKAHHLVFLRKFKQFGFVEITQQKAEEILQRPVLVGHHKVPDGTVIRVLGDRTPLASVDLEFFSLEKEMNKNFERTLNPEEILVDKQDTVSFDMFEQKFHTMTDKQKARVLKKFLKENHSTDSMMNEKNTAENLLAQLERNATRK